MPPRYPLYCGRCGADCSERRGGQLRAEDYIELWQEHCALQQDYADLRSKYLRMREAHDEAINRRDSLIELVNQLEVPSPEQLELRQLRAIVAELPVREEEGAPF